MIKTIDTFESFHFIGIGGSGMSGLARLLKQKGKFVAGSDEKESSATLSLTREGVKIYTGHDAKNIETSAEIIIYSSAIPEANPELQEAKKRNLPLLTYAQAVGFLTKEKTTICICGTHGKTTTTALIAASFIHAGADPTVIVGAPIPELQNHNERLGKGEHFILESCEYRRAFLNFSPSIIILNNIEADHLDYYKNIEDYKSAFAEFIDTLPENGLLIANIDDKNVRSVLEKVRKVRIITFGTGKNADYQLQDHCIYFHEKKILELQLQIPGQHNMMNACAAVALASELKLDLEKVKTALENYRGAARRFEYKGTIGKTVLIDDYGHHPTEIVATLRGAREKFGPDKKILCIFQPHQYSRTHKLLEGFAKAFQDADEVIISNILRVRDSEEEVASINEETLVAAISAHHPKVSFGHGLEKTAELIRGRMANFDVVITMGAGDVGKIGEVVLTNYENIDIIAPL